MEHSRVIYLFATALVITYIKKNIYTQLKYFKESFKPELVHQSSRHLGLIYSRLLCVDLPSSLH